MLIKLNGKNDSSDAIQKVIDAWEDGKVVVVPTDSVYAFTCSIKSSSGMQQICRIQGLDPEDAMFSVLFSDFSMLSEYVRPLSNYQFRILKKILPGPYTVILEAAPKIHKMLLSRRKTIGVRIPDHPVTLHLLKAYGQPVFSSSVHDPLDEITDYLTDPEQIELAYENKADIIVDGGFGNLYPTTVIDLKPDHFTVIREGLGSTEEL